MASVQTQISQLPTAGAITGDELVPIVQNGLTVQTTTGAISASPSQTQTFLTVNQEPTLPNSRALSASSGITLTDGGAQAALQIALNGAAASLNAVGTGIVAKTSSTAVTARSIASGTTGLSVANGNGVSGDPTISLTGQVLSLANASGAGLVALPDNGTVIPVEITGTANEIVVANGTGASGNPTIGIAENPELPGVESVLVPSGTTAERPSLPENGMIRYNTDTALFEGYLNGSWQNFAAGSTGVVSIATGTGLTGGPITSTGTISIDSTVATLTGVQTLTNKTISSPIITNNLKFEAAGISAYSQFANSLASFITNANNFQEVYMLNQNNGSEASADYVLYNDASDVNSYFIDMGMNSSNYTSATYTIFTPNSGYLFTGGGLSGQASDLFIGTSNAASDVIFFTGDVVAANARGRIKGNTGNFLIGTATDTGYKLNVNGTTYFGGASTFGSTVLLNADPTLALQAATKQYVDQAVSTGLHLHQPVLVATTANLTATYNNGSSGVGATLTNSGSQAALSIDGVSMSVNDRVLVWQQTAQAQNGIYVVTTVGSGATNWVLTRSSDADTYIPTSDTGLGGGDYFYVQEGTLGQGDSYVCTNDSTITFGTTAITFAQFSGAITYVGGTNIDITGQSISLTGTVASTNGGTGTNTVTTGDLLYGSAADTWSKLPLSTAYKSLVINAAGTQVEWNAVALNQSAAVSGQLQIANGGTGLSTYTAGDITYYASGTTLSKLGIGTANYILTSSGTAPQYTNPSSITVGSATTSTNLAGGIASQIPYQTGAGATSFIANGTAGQVLTSAGTSAPAWSGINGGTF